MKTWKTMIIAFLLAAATALCVGCNPKVDNTKKPSQGSNQSDGSDFGGREEDFDFGNVDSPFDTPISKFE